MSKKIHRKLAVCDAETDPFLYERVPAPFCWGFFDGTDFRTFWGDDCIAKFLRYLESQPPLVLYAHNGGRFDFFLLLEYLENPVKIINGRIVEARLGRHILRDSFAIIPIALKLYEKDTIDYEKMEYVNREKHKPEIISYLRTDCVSLFTLVSAFRERFGDKLTIGGTALGKLREMHPFETPGETHDKKIRPFYFGGRVQTFERGILRGNWKIFDVNSMYPHVMASRWHPTGATYAQMSGADFFKYAYRSGFPYFVEIETDSAGALPLRDEDTGKLEFPIGEGFFRCTSHEFETATDLGLLANTRVSKALVPENRIRFDEYVGKYVADKIHAKQTGNRIGELFAKFLLNSAYGKTGQNPENYRDFFIRRVGEDPPENPAWRIHTEFPGGEIYEKETSHHIYYDVAIAASITGAARAVLMFALYHAKRPVYCDTDSIICEALPSMQTSETELGAWKLEKEGDTAVIVGRKLYGLFSDNECVKIATKGFHLGDPSKLFDLWRGAELIFESQAPHFKLDGTARFTRRRILREFLD